MSRFPIQTSMGAHDYAALLVGRLIVTWASVDEWLYGSITHCQHAKVIRGTMSMSQIPLPSGNFDNRVTEWRRLCAELAPDQEMMRQIDRSIVELKSFSLVRHHFAHNLILRISPGENDDSSRFDISNSKQMKRQVQQMIKNPRPNLTLNPIATYTFTQIIDAAEGLERARSELAAASAPIIAYRPK